MKGTKKIIALLLAAATAFSAAACSGGGQTASGGAVSGGASQEGNSDPVPIKAKAAEFINFMVSDEGNELLRLGLEGIHYTKDGDTITYNEEERAKDAFSPDGWAHAIAWGSFFWPLESEYMPETEPDKERALETVELATEAQIPNLIKQKTPLEIENSNTLNDIFIQYFSDMLQGKIGIEEGAAELSQKWRSQGGEEMLKEVQAAYEAQGAAE